MFKIQLFIYNFTSYNQIKYTSTTASTILTTDRYVKSTPTTLEHIKLLENTGENFYDYPLEYEITSMGDYYQEMVTENDLPVLYAIVPSNFQFPPVPYVVLSNLNLYLSNIE